MQTLVFLKKEYLENSRNRKLFMLLILALLFGFMGPIMAKMTPDIISTLVDSKLAAIIPTPTVQDGWLQFYKNIGQLFMVIFFILFADSLSKELSQKTLVPLITKGLKRTAVLNGKWLFLASAWLGSLLLSALVTYYYNFLVFKTFGAIQSFLPVLEVGLFGLLLISALILGSVILEGYGSLLFVALTIGLSFLLGIPKATKEYSPLGLMADNTARMFDQQLAIHWQGYVLPIVLTISFFMLAKFIFSKKLIA